MQWQPGGTIGPELRRQNPQPIPAENAPFLASRQQPDNTQRIALAPVNQALEPAEKPKLPSLSTMFGYLDRTPPLPPSQLAPRETAPGPIDRFREIKSSFGTSPIAVSVGPSFTEFQRNHPSQFSGMASSIPLHQYQQASFPSPPDLLPAPQYSQGLPPPVLQPTAKPAGLPHQGNKFRGVYSMGRTMSPHPEPLRVSNISAGSTSRHSREDLSTEDEQNVAISDLADSDATPQLLENGRYQCPLCPRNYKYAKHVRRHIINHTNIYPHSCTRCNALFRRKDAQRRHMQRIHPDIPPHTYMNARIIPDSDGKSDESR